jgi:hypothetical protein
VDKHRWVGMGHALMETREAGRSGYREAIVTWAGQGYAVGKKEMETGRLGRHVGKGRVGWAGLGWLRENLRIRPMAGIRNRKVFLIFDSFTNSKSI